MVTASSSTVSVSSTASASTRPSGSSRPRIRDEGSRLAALRDYGLTENSALPELDALVRVASAVARVPTATINLIDDQVQCQIGTVGFRGRTTPRGDSMCARQLDEPGFVWVRDARRSPIWAESPWVTGELATVVFYASAPLVNDDGHVLGTLCVFDREAHDLDDGQIASLCDLATAVVALLERRRQTRRAALLAVEAETQRAQYSLAARELEARTELVRAVLDSVDVAIVAAEPDGRLSLFNSAATSWHGLPADGQVSPEEHASRYTLYEADGTTPLPAGRVPLHRALIDGEVAGAEVVIAPQGRPARHVRCSGRAMARADGSPLGAVVAMSDVTADREQRLALEQAHEELWQHRRELLRSNEELADFAATASHDLRSPLAVIEGYLALLLDVYGDGMEPRARDWVQISRTAVARMLSLTEALLCYAQAGAASGEREPVDVRATVAEVLSDLEAVVRGAEATVEVVGEVPDVVADPVLFRQLLQNLLANAVAYRCPDRACRVEVRVDTQADGWVVSVADNGRGIPAEHRDRVFGMFARVDPGDRSGSGIGLATCARIVAQHGGSIWVEATPGGGATFRFTLQAR